MLAKPCSLLGLLACLLSGSASAASTTGAANEACKDVPACIGVLLKEAGNFDMRPSFAAMQRIRNFPQPQSNAFLASKAWQKRAQQERDKGQLDAARDLLGQALVIAPDNEMLHIDLAQLYLQEQQLDKAQQHFQSALALVPWRVEAWQGLAMLYQALGQPQQAAASLVLAHDWAMDKTASKTQITLKSKGAAYALALEKINARNVAVVHAWQLAQDLPASAPKFSLMDTPGLACQPAQYPRSAQKQEKEGQVVLQFLLDKDGSVIDSRVAQSSGTIDLDAAARLNFSACFGIKLAHPLAHRSAATTQIKWQLEAAQ